MLNPADYRVKPGHRARLGKRKPNSTRGATKSTAVGEFDKLTARLKQLQEVLFAEGKHALLVVFQAMDTGGKDGTIHAVFGPLNAQGCNVASFKAPTSQDLTHDFLWRIHAQAPGKGRITIFNRSHYEDVLAARIKEFVPRGVWKKRYRHINDFESLLAGEGTTIVKFFLHISKAYQKERLQDRLDQPDKLWKFNPLDLKERERWDAYQEAYEDALTRCSTHAAPWYVVPAEHHWFRNLLVARVLVETLESLKMRYPKPAFDPRMIVIR